MIGQLQVTSNCALPSSAYLDCASESVETSTASKWHACLQEFRAHAAAHGVTLRMMVTPKSRQSWRRWLERNHDSRTDVWVVFYKRRTGKPTLSYSEAVEEALCFGWIDGVKRSIDHERYTHRFSPRKPDSKWSALNRERAERMEQMGEMTAAGRSAMEIAKRRGTWSAAPPSIDLTMPPELAVRLQQNWKAAAYFDSLAPSYKQRFIAWINTAKRRETKERRASEAVELLGRGERLGMR